MLAHMRRRIVGYFLLLAGIPLFLISCNTTNEKTQVDNVQSFQLSILDKDISLECWQQMGYTQETSWPIFQRAYQSRVPYNITENDIESYNWTEQSIKLTKVASRKLMDSLDCSGDDISGCITNRVFVVVINDTPAYGGVFIFPGPAQAIQFPVIYTDMVENQVVFIIRPFYYLPIDADVDDGWRSVIKDERVESLFMRLDKIAK